MTMFIEYQATILLNVAEHCINSHTNGLCHKYTEKASGQVAAVMHRRDATHGSAEMHYMGQVW